MRNVIILVLCLGSVCAGGLTGINITSEAFHVEGLAEETGVNSVSYSKSGANPVSDGVSYIRSDGVPVSGAYSSADRDGLVGSADVTGDDYEVPGFASAQASYSISLEPTMYGALYAELFTGIQGYDGAYKYTLRNHNTGELISRTITPKWPTIDDYFTASWNVSAGVQYDLLFMAETWARTEGWGCELDIYNLGFTPADPQPPTPVPAPSAVLLGILGFAPVCCKLSSQRRRKQ